MSPIWKCALQKYDETKTDLEWGPVENSSEYRNKPVGFIKY
jgi:hypothetical protein